MKIGVVRLRSRVWYKQPLDYFISSYFYLLQRYMEDRKLWDRVVMVIISLNNVLPSKENLEELGGCDVVIIPTENEFHYHIPGYIHSLDLARSNDFVARVVEIIKGKRIVLLASEQADTVELYKKYVLKNSAVDITRIDENDFVYGLHGLQYHFIKDYRDSNLFAPVKNIDFVYFGTSKRQSVEDIFKNDMRHIVLKEVKNSTLHTKFIGRFDNFKADIKFIKNIKVLVKEITTAKYTICFQWPNHTQFTTSRYHEALACDIIPLVWQNYDSNDYLHILPQQRCFSSSEIISKCLTTPLLEDIKAKYLENLPSKNQYYEQFKEKIENVLYR